MIPGKNGEGFLSFKGFKWMIAYQGRTEGFSMRVSNGLSLGRT
jgi:hypothetical protein